MSKVRVHELAKEFDLENKEVIERLSAAGVEVKTHSSSVYADEARAILSKPAQKAAKPKRAGVMIVRKKPQVKKEEAEAAEPKKAVPPMIRRLRLSQSRQHLLKRQRPHLQLPKRHRHG